MASTDSSQENYFNSYGDLSIHELMLKDQPRTLAYRRFFETNGHLIKDKVVMDVGAGTGILSLFAASAGAKKVLAVEASSIASLCAEIVADNQLSHVIEVIHGTVETICLPEGITTVDIIVSEWMGFYLLHESMLDSVIVARDRFLAPDGILVPSHASLFVAPVDMTDHFKDRAAEWSNIYGFDFSAVASQMNMEEVSKPLITSLKPSILCSDPQKFISYNLKTVVAEDVKKISKVLKFPITQDSKIFGFAAWFDVEFSGTSIHISSGITSRNELVVSEKGDAHSLENICSDSQNSDCNLYEHDSTNCDIQDSADCDVGSGSLNVKLPTGPSDPVTHWKQTVLFLPRAIVVEGGLNLCCHMKMTQDNTNKRHYNIAVTLIDEDDIDNDSSDEQDNSEQGIDVSDFGESTDHPVPCTCGSNHCQLIAALVDKYEVEHQELEEEADMSEQEAKVAAARQMAEDFEDGGWQMDSSASNTSVNDSFNGISDDV